MKKKIEHKNNNVKSNNTNDPTFEKNLKMYRLLFLITIIMYPLFGYTNTFILNFETLNDFYLRLIIVFSISIFTLYSYKNQFIRTNFYYIIAVYCYIGMIHLSYVGLYRGFNFNHDIGVMLLFIGTSYIFNSISHLLRFHIFTLIIIESAIYFSPFNELNKTTSCLIFFSFIPMTFFVLQLKAKSEKIIKGNEANIHALIENTEGLIWSFGLDRKYITFNKSYEDFIQKLVNIKPIIGHKVIHDQFEKKLKLFFENSYKKVFKNNTVFLENKILINNELRFYNFSFTPIIINENNIIGVTILGNDITKNKQQERLILNNQLQLNKAQEIAKIGSWTFDWNSKEFIVSKEIASIFEVEHIPNQNIFELYKTFISKDKHDDFYENLIKFIELKKNFTNERQIFLKNGSNKWIRTIVEFVTDNSKNLLSINGVTQDITIEKHIEINLVKSKELAEQLKSAKEQFIANMSHEIRTPLNGIIGFTKILLQNDHFTEDQIKYLNAIKSSGDILLVIINDILDLSKIDAGKMSLEYVPINISTICKQVAGNFEYKIIEKKINFNYFELNEININLLGDPVRISQILLNILSNAIKFTPENGTINLSVSSEQKSEDKTEIKFQISDTGIGISEEKLQMIFDPFTQTSEDITRKYGGTGLGLSIVKKLVKIMEGTIEVESVIDKGSLFTIQICLKNDLTPKDNVEVVSESEVSEEINTKDIKILLAEDNMINQLLATTVLKQFGFNVVCVENGELAVNRVLSEDFDLILMDLMMPEMDGYEATKIIRSMDNLLKKTIPIIALTADVTATDINKSVKVGMNDYITKPFDSENLFKKIIFQLKNRKI
ncbi:MAG: response regulator [Flavobacteriia bacterium]|nr:response regulator [Flavobacteriia bacterium]